MKKLIALISAIAVMGTMSLTSLAAIEVTPNAAATGAALAKWNEKASGGSQLSVFAKNPTGATLSKGSYGIVVGGIVYVGQKDVTSEQSWTIKLIAPAGTFADSAETDTSFGGDYMVKAFITVDGAKLFSDEVKANVQ